MTRFCPKFLLDACVLFSQLSQLFTRFNSESTDALYVRDCCQFTYEYISLRISFGLFCFNFGHFQKYFQICKFNQKHEVQASGLVTCSRKSRIFPARLCHGLSPDSTDRPSYGLPWTNNPGVHISDESCKQI